MSKPSGESGARRLALDLGAEPRVVITAVGARGAGGQSARQVAMCARARSGPETLQSVFLDDRRFAIPFACARELPPDLFGFDRLLALGAPALREAHGGAPGDRVPLLLALAKPEPAASPEGSKEESPRDPVESVAPRPATLTSARELLHALARDAGVPIDGDRSLVLTHGNAGGAHALELARVLLLGPNAPRAVIVGGVDSDYEPGRIRSLLREGRIGATGSDYVPGEAAGFLVLERAGEERPALARVLAVATRGMLAGEAGVDGAAPVAGAEAASEDEPVDPELVAAMAPVAARDRRLGWILTDVTGEGERASAWSSASREVLPALPDDAPERIDEPMGTRLGGLGAASGPVFAAIACARWRLGVAPEARALVVLSSEGAGRGAFLLEHAVAPAVTDGDEVENAPRPRQSPAHELARVAEQVLAAPSSELRAAPRGRPDGPRATLRSALEEANQSLAALAASDLLDPEHLSRLDEAARSAEALGASLARTEAELDDAFALPSARSIAEIAKLLREVRPRVIDKLVAVEAIARPRAEPARAKGDTARGSPRTRVPDRASTGVPFIYPFPWDERRPPGDPASELEDDVDDELDDAAGEAPEGALAPDPGTERLRELARDCFESIGRLSSLRRVGDWSSPWSPELGRFDQRMLDELDLLASLAMPYLPDGEQHAASRAEKTAGPPSLDVLAELEAFMRSRGGLPAAAFARSLVLGCAAGPQPPRWAVSAARTATPEVLAAHTEALKLASNPAVSDAVEELCSASEPELLLLALEVLRSRRTVHFGRVVVPLSHPDARVRAAAARALACAPEREAVIALLEDAVEREADVVAANALTESLVRLRAPFALDRIRRRLDESPRGAHAAADARLLALAGAAADTERVAAAAALGPEGLEALGWFGRVTAVELLIRVLEGASGLTVDDSIRRAAARSLQRITGGVPATTGATSAVVPGSLSAVRVERLEYRAAPWRAYWQQHGHSFGVRSKIRFGRPHEAKASLDELAERGVSEADRRAAALEYELSTTPPRRAAELDDWVARQLAPVGGAAR